jgi:hypothetical protein
MARSPSSLRGNKDERQHAGRALENQAIVAKEQHEMLSSTTRDVALNNTAKQQAFLRENDPCRPARGPVKGSAVASIKELIFMESCPCREPCKPRRLLRQ